MDFMIATGQKLSYMVVYHPVYSVFGSVVIFACMLKFYCKLTAGVCEIEQDLSGKTVLITGSSNGIGKSTAIDLARRNARILLACRNMEKAKKVAEEIKSSTGNKNVLVKCLDLSSFESVRECARSVLATENKLDILINNAGISGGQRRKLTEDGCELIMQTNHLGPFLLTNLLLGLLKKSSPSRIINVSSAAHNMADFNLDDLSNERRKHPFYVYCNSKLANVLFTRELAERLRGTGVTVNSLHPGCVRTDIMTNVEGFLSFITNIIFILTGKTPDEGAQTTIQLAVDPRMEKVTGKYYSDCKEDVISKLARDKSTARRLFEISERIVGASY